MSSCLCIGPTGSGKTLLLKRLQSPEVNEGTSTVETVGSNMVHIPRKLVGEKGRNKAGDDKDFMVVREIGGSIAPLWPSYFSPDKLVFHIYTLTFSKKRH
jgi:ADP-ribosylation factor-like protein 1